MKVDSILKAGVQVRYNSDRLECFDDEKGCRL